MLDFSIYFDCNECTPGGEIHSYSLGKQIASLSQKPKSFVLQSVPLQKPSTIPSSLSGSYLKGWCDRIRLDSGFVRQILQHVKAFEQPFYCSSFQILSNRLNLISFHCYLYQVSKKYTSFVGSNDENLVLLND